MSDFTALSRYLTNEFTGNEKQKEGIFFTPPTIIKIVINRIQEIPDLHIENILEPSCGSCEIIHYLNKTYTGKNIIGIEKNIKIYDKIRNIPFENNNVTLLHRDYLQWDVLNEFKQDLIIGNPPYFVVKKADVDESYYDMLDGRPNIFLLFIINSLQKLNDNGILAFILPQNFINCAYYSKVRNYIFHNFAIIDIINTSDDLFIDTKQETFIIILQKKNDKSENLRFCLLHNIDNIIFNTPSNITKITELYESSVSLNSLGFTVSVGTVVWNQCKDLLTDDVNNTRLIYSGDIKNNTLTTTIYKNPIKKNFIRKNGNNMPVLVLNRGYGKGKYIFNYCLINLTTPYLIENHLMVIKHKGGLPIEDLLPRYQQIINSFCNPKTKEFVNIYFGNNAINTTELKFTLPIYL